MEKMITAMRDPLINKKIRDLKKIDVIGKDIFYKEGILEFLEYNQDIQYILIKEELIEENEINNFYEKIKKYNRNIILIIFIEKNKKIININKEKNKNIKYIEKFEEIKKVFSKKSEIISTNQKGKIISILGSGGVGKSLITIEIAKKLAQRKKKVLIIDFDILNSSIHTLLNLTRKRAFCYLKTKFKIEVLTEVIKYFELENEEENDNIERKLEQLKSEYDFILIDTCLYDLWAYLKRIMQMSNNILFILEPNLLGIKKAKNLLTIYEEKWNIDYRKISIVLNKENKESINFKIIKICFSKYKILERIKEKKSNIFIKKVKIFFYKNDNEYERIIKKICNK